MKDKLKAITIELNSDGFSLRLLRAIDPIYSRGTHTEMEPAGQRNSAQPSSFV